MSKPSTPTAVLDREPGEGTQATPTADVSPLSYTQLRLLAECTAGLEETVNFVFTAGGTLQTTADPEPSQVLVPARDQGKYPRNVLRMQAGTGTELVLDPGFADAAFWSDSSVQKFVFPYVASCAGKDAAAALWLLQSVWNYYPADQVTVYGLVHVVRHTSGTPLSSENRLQVVYAERPQPGAQASLSIAPLGVFYETYPSPQNPAPAPQGADGAPPVTYHRGSSGKGRQHPDYAVLRALAEHACSLCDEPRYFMLKAGEDGYRAHTTEDLPPVQAGDIVIPAYNASIPAHRPRLDGVWCHAADAPGPNLATRGDAVFWSDGAIDQFMYPYYASKGGMEDGLRDLLEMSYVWTGHVPGLDGWEREALEKEREALKDAAFSEGVAGVEGAEDEPFVDGLVHMPTSEWIPEEEPAGQEGSGVAEPAGEHATITRVSARREVGVLYRSGGQTRLVRGERFMARERVPRG